MKKYFYLFMCVLTMSFTMMSLSSCDKEDNDEYYAGESEEDYKPNTYTITSFWDFSSVSGLTASQQNELKQAMENEVKATAVYNTKADAVKDFNSIVNDASSDSDMAKFKGAKATFTLKRGTAIIKKSTLSW